MTKTARKSTARLKAARKSWTVRVAAFVPVALALAEALREQLPAMAGLMSGWGLVALSVGVSTVIAVLRVRAVEAAEPGDGE